MKTTLFCFFAVLVNGSLFAQQRTEIPYSSNEIEMILENNAADAATSSTTLDELEFYQLNPVDVNTASFQELAEVPFLSSSAALSILRIRTKFGRVNPSDLRSLTDLDVHSLEMAMPFLAFSSGESANSPGNESAVRYSFRSRGSRQLQLRKPFRDGEYTGNPVRQYHRLEINEANLSGGFLYDRDPGESYNAGFMSGYLEVENAGIVRKLVVGNYSVNSGEGLTLSGMRTSSKGGNAVSQVKSTGQTIVPHLSTDEAHYFRGAAVSLESYPSGFTAFFSQRAIDATIDTNNSITSIYTAGLFRSASELRKRGTVNQTVVGGIGTLRIGTTHSISFTAIRVDYDKDFTPASSPLFTGKEIIVTGASAKLAFENIEFFGEVAGNAGALKSGSVGMICEVSKRLSMSAHVRSYAQTYSNPFAFAFGEQNGAVSGETGRYVGAELRFSEAMRISAYYDEFVVPVPESYSSNGREIVVRYEGVLSRIVSGFFQYRQKKKSEAHVVLNTEQYPCVIAEDRDQKNLRLSCSFRISKGIELVERVELTAVNYPSSHVADIGMLTFTELNASPARSPFRGTARMVFFDTDSYDSRLYEYENEVRGGYSLPALYGKGIRWYFVAGWKVLAHAELSVKYTETLKPGSRSLGSDSSEILGPLDNSVTFQLDIML